ncbi:MAG: hypothetical protein ACHP65_10160 [Legionellales bacterium]
MSREEKMKDVLMQIKENEAKQAREKKRSEDRQLQRQRQAEETRYTTDEGGNKVLAKEELRRMTEKNLKAEGQAFNNWYSAMLGFWGYCTVFAKSSTFGQTGRNFIKDNFLNPLGDKISDWFTGAPEVDLPKLEYAVNLTDDNKLSLDTLAFPGKERMNMNDEEFKANNAKLNHLFKVGVVGWLEELGYESDAELTPEDVHHHDISKKFSSSYHNARSEQHEPLTKEKFLELKKDHLNDFLTGKFELNFVEQASEKPAMKP